MKRLLIGLAAVPFIAGATFAQQPTPAAGFGNGGYIEDLQILTEYDAYGGASFGNIGSYEVIVGIAHGKLNPSNPANAGVVDLKLAPRDATGLVDYSEDFVILRPKSAANAKRVLFYDVVNRGNKLVLGAFNGGSSSFAAGQQGNALLLRLGYTIVWSGWQGNVAETGHGDTSPIGTSFPVAVNPDGTPITGQTRDEFILDSLDPSNGPGVQANGTALVTLNYPAATLDQSQATFNWRPTWRTSSDPLTEGMEYTAPSTPVPLSDWSYVNNGTQLQFTPPPGSDLGSIFEFVYQAKNPTVMGIGFAAVRDLITFLNYDRTDHEGHPNPLNDFRKAPCSSDQCRPNRNFDVTIMEGISQSGRFTRDFLWRGFNYDARDANGNGGHSVFNGMFPIIAGSRKTYTDFRWSQPGRWSKEHEDHWQPGDQFPFAYNVITDPVSGRTDGILKKCLATGTCPKIVQLDGGFEFFGARASLVATDGEGHDLRIPDNVRLYEAPGTNHGGGGGVNTLSQPTQCIYPSSQVIESTFDRALTPVLVDWVANGTAPPPSEYPSVAAGTLAPPTDQRAVGFPDLTSAGYPYYGYLYNPIVVTDYSNAVPVPDLSEAYKVLVSKTNADGNEIGGIDVPEIAIPIATYPDWNVRGPGHSPGDACISSASTLPFAANKAARLADGDPRPSFQERYGAKAQYVAEVQAAAEALVAKRLLLPEDVSVYVNAAQSESLFP